MINPNSFEDPSYTAYYKDVGKHSILTAEEERLLFQRYHTCPHCSTPFAQKVKRTNCPECGTIILNSVAKGSLTCTKCLSKFDSMTVPKACLKCGSGRDIDARDKLVVSNLRFVIKRAQSLTQDPVRRNILISAGNEGLMVAVDKYKPSKGTRFLTYAEWWIRKEMYDAINNSPLIHIPPQKRRAILKTLKEGKYICIHCGARVSSLDEHCSIMCTEDQHHFEKPDVTTSSLLGNGVSIDKMRLASPSDIEELWISSDMQQSLREVLKNMVMSERDRYILLCYYDVAMPDRKSGPKNLQQISVLLRITPERVRQLKKKTLERVKKELINQSIGGVLV